LKVDKINAYKEVFRNHLQITQSYNELYKYECLQNFEANWDLSALDLKTMYDNSLQSKLSGRLWGGSQNSAKEVMLLFLDMDKEFVRSMFRDLYNEDKDLGMRINRFVFHCDQMLEQLQSKQPKWTTHFHGESEVAFYLAFNNPQVYPLFNYGPFAIMMQRLEVKSVPESYELERYFKLCKGLYTLLKRDIQLVRLHKEVREAAGYYGDDTVIMVHDYLVVCAGHKESVA